MYSHPSLLSYAEACTYLISLASLEPLRQARAQGADGLARTRALLDALGNPQDHLKFVHITGTSGKGSTLAFLQHLLAAAGVPVLGFTSPHVTTLLERMTTGAGELPVAAFLRAVERLRPVIHDFYCHSPHGAPTFFEAMFGLALVMARDLGISLVLVEAGVGGTLDTTQVIPAPLVAIVTDVGLDHQKVLGETLSLIAADKAGIFKKGSYLLTGATREEALIELEARAAALGQPLERILPQESRVNFEGAAPPPSSRVLALRAYELLSEAGLHLPSPPVEEALARYFLPGRCEVLGSDLVVDLAHNPDKVAFFDEYFHHHYGQGGVVIFTQARDKDLASTLPRLRTFDTLVITRLVRSERKMWSPREIAGVASGLFRQVVITLSPEEALVAARQLRGLHTRIAATGSTFLVGELRRYFQTEEELITRGRLGRVPSGG